MTLRVALDRTLRLVRDQVGGDDIVADQTIMAALSTTTVALIADDVNIPTHAAQTTYVTAAMLMARSAHQVFLMAPNVPLVGPQPPLQPWPMIDALVEIGGDMLPGIGFSVRPAEDEVDLAVALGDSPIKVKARRVIRINAEPWSGIIEPADRPRRWAVNWRPFGALAAAALAANEAFKASMAKLQPHAMNKRFTAEMFAVSDDVTFHLAPADTPLVLDLGAIDCISGGAITNAALYCLARVLAVRAHGNIIEPDHAARDNLNRYVLLRRSSADRGASKAPELAEILRPAGLQFRAISERFEGGPFAPLLAPTVLVGVDHIPTRWAVQRANPRSLVIGATTHWSAMASVHAPGLGCAQCLHPEDDPGDEPIPTLAAVSFWAGLLAASYIVRLAAGKAISPLEQCIFMTPFRPENPYRAPVPRRRGCPICHEAALALGNS
jgi:hypothetical protein